MNGEGASWSPRILSVGKAAEIGDVRRRVLCTRYQVVACKGLWEAEALCREQRFDLILLCHSLSVGECEQIIQAARAASPDIKVLRIVSLFSDKSPTSVNGVVSALSGPLALFDSIEKVLHQESPRPGL